MKKYIFIALACLVFCPFKDAEATNILKKGNDLKWAIIALCSPVNLPIFIEESVPKRSYGKVDIKTRTVDYEVGIASQADLNALRAAVAHYSNPTEFYKAAKVVVKAAEKRGNLFYHDIEWTGGKATLVLIKKPFDHTYFETRFKSIYDKHPYLWATKTSSVWARNLWDKNYWLNDQSAPTTALLGDGVKVGFWDEGLAKDHMFGDRYRGGYDYIHDMPLGPNNGGPQSPIWKNTKKHLHGHGLSHITVGPEGMLPHADVYFDVMFAVKHKATIAGMRLKLDTVHADTEALPYMQRVGDPFGPAREMVDRGVRVINLSYGTVTSGQSPLGRGLRASLSGKYMIPSADLMGYLTDNGIALTINAGNAMDEKGPQHPASLASDAVGFGGRILSVGAYTPEGTSGRSNWATENAEMQAYHILAPSYGVTSNAAPVAAGAIGLLMALYPDLKAEEAIKVLIDTAVSLAPRARYGSGLIDLEKASQAVINKYMRKDPNLGAKLGVDLSVNIYPKAEVPEMQPVIQDVQPIVPAVKTKMPAKGKKAKKAKKAKKKAKAKAKKKAKK